MLNKVYKKTKEIIKNNLWFIISVIVIFLLFAIPLPYYINAPGGLINLDTRISIKDSYKSTGSFNLTYVSELKANIPFLLMTYVHKDWKLISEKDIVLSNETIKDSEIRDHLMIEEAIDNAIIYGFQKAKEEVTITEKKVYVTYISEESITDLKIGDQIVAVDNIDIVSKQQLQDILQSKNEHEKVNITVISNNQVIEKQATMLNEKGRIIVGIMLSEIKEYKTNKEVKLNFHSSESGPSGGLMMTLQVYNSLIPNDITKGLKIVGTGTIDLDGTVGEIGGVEYKIKGAVKKKADIFFVPNGVNYEDAKKVIDENNYKLTLVPINTFEEALEYLNNLP